MALHSIDLRSPFWPTSTPWAILEVACFGLAIFCLTFLVTSLRSVVTVRYKQGPAEPPIEPYAVPFLGSVPEFLWNREHVITKAFKRYGSDVPVTVKLLNRRLKIIKDRASISALYKSTREVNSEKWLVQVLVNAFGIESSDAPFYLNDNTGLGVHPLPGSRDIPPEHRIFLHVWRASHVCLTGSRLDATVRQFVSHLSSQLRQCSPAPPSSEWMDVPDLYSSFIRPLCFRASTESFCGSHIFDLTPTFADDFWTFDKHLPDLFLEKPRWLASAAFKARDKAKANMLRWHDFAHEHYDVDNANSDPREWEPYFGSRFMRTRHEFFKKMPLSKSTLAGDDLGSLWGSAANSIPAISWMILEILQRPATLRQVRKEIAPFITRDPADPAEMIVDTEGLCSQLLLQSIYAEVLRIHTGTVISRVPQTEKFVIDGWHYRKGEGLIISTYDTARDPRVWNEGSAENPRALDSFWPERFIKDPRDPFSGPLKSDSSRAAVNDKSAEKDADAAPKFTMEGTEGSWNPYGGGTRMCPGRHFAKREMIVSAAMFLTAFDIELTNTDAPVEDDRRYYMFGVMHPKGPIPGRIRRRDF